MGNWRKQDWYWLTGILIFLNLFIMAFRLSDNVTFMNIFSFMVNGISIALAFVAMYTSFKQNSDNQTLTSQMSQTLVRMDEKINSMGQKVSEFTSVEEVKKMLETRLNLAAESIEETISEESGNLSKDEVVDIIKDELSSFGKSFDQLIKPSEYKVNIIEKSQYNSLPSKIKVKEMILDILTKNKDTELSMLEIRNHILKLTKSNITRSTYKELIDELISENKVEKVYTGETGMLNVRFKAI